MGIDLDSTALKLLLEDRRCNLVLISRDYDFIAFEPIGGKVIDHLEDIGIIADSEVRADLPLLDITGIDAYDDIQFVLQGLEDLHLVVLIEAREDSRCVFVMQKLSAAFNIEASGRIPDPLKYIA